MIHLCTACSEPSGNHPEECPSECNHLPPLCCEGCDCGSLEEAHPATRFTVEAEKLTERGYVSVDQWKHLNVGDRVRHIGEQYYEAQDGTAVIEGIFVRRETDVEIIAKRDKPGWGGPKDTHGFWANYHTVKVGRLSSNPGTTEVAP